MERAARSKYIALAHKTFYLNVHSILDGEQNHRMYILKPEEGLLFHYRVNCMKQYCNNKNKSLIDLNATKFAPEIFEKVDKVCAKIFKNGMCPIDTI